VGFLGMHATDEHPVPIRYVGLAENFYLKGRVWKMRTGITRAGSQLTGGSGKPVQAVGHFEELDGTLHTFAICNADLHTYNWGTNSWSLIDLSVQGITLDSSSLCDWAVSRGRLIVTDGVNKPFMYDPSGPTYTTLSNAPIAGGVEIYYDKVFFFDLPGANSNVFEWSDEGDPVNGYTGDNQDWEFAQTDAGAVTNMVGLNEIMPVMKANSVALLKGAVEDAFQTDAVREGVSETDGPPGKFGTVVVEGDVFYITKSGPRQLHQGYRLLPLDRDEDNVNMLGPHWGEFDKSEIANAIAFYDENEDRNHVVWLMALDGATAKYEGLLYCVEEGSWARIAFPSTFDFKCVGSVENTEGEEFVMLGDDDGNVWIYGDDTVTTDNGTGFDARLRSRQYGQSLGTVQKRLAQVDWRIDITSAGLAGATRIFRDGIITIDHWLDSERGFSYPSSGIKVYRRGFNDVGWTVGWELIVNSAEGQCEVHSAVTQITTVGAHPSRG
jgi:hypothetical protein